MKKTKGQNVQIMWVTPEMAREWLKRNSGNRPLSQTTVAGYVDEQINGRWRLVGDAIQIDTQGTLINGQHRMTAVSQSGVTCQFLVLFDCDDETKSLIDLGRARTVSDTLRMEYGIERARMVTGAVSALDLFVHERKLKMTVGHAIEMLDPFGQALRWVTRAMPGKSRFSSSPIVAALTYAHRTAPAAVEEFTTQLLVGDELKAESPILKCRNHILQRGGAGTASDEKRHTFLLVLTAIRHHLNKQRTRSVKVDPDVIAYFARAHASAKARLVAA